MADERMDKIIGESFHKSANVILGARLTTSAAGERPPPVRQTGNRKWFNLDIPELECITSEVSPWRRGNMQCPLILQVILEPRPDEHGQEAAGGGDWSQGPHEEVLLEEWVLEHRPLSAPSSTGGGDGASAPQQQQQQQDGAGSVSSISSSPGSSGGAPLTRRQAAWQDPHAIYKRLVIFHRSLYSYVRVLPAFRLLKALKRHPQVPFDITSRIVPAWTMAAGKTAGSFRFAPVDTYRGAFQASVTFRTGPCPIPEFEELQRISRASPSPRTRIIADYVRTPPTSNASPVSASAPAASSPLSKGASGSGGGGPSSGGGLQQRQGSVSTSPGTHHRASPGTSPNLEMVERPSSSLPPSRHPWGSSPVEVKAPEPVRWAASPSPGDCQSHSQSQQASGRPPAAPQPSLLPKATPWGSPGKGSYPMQASPSPRSTLNQPPSVPSSAPQSSVSPGSSAPISAYLGSGASGSPLQQGGGPSALLMPGGQQKAGFHPAAGAAEGVGSRAAGSTRPSQGIKLAQGGITAAAEAGQMDRRQFDVSAHQVQTGQEVPPAAPGSPFLQWQQSTSGAAAPQMKSLLHPLQQDGTAEASQQSPASLLSQCLRSSPVCIPGKERGMPRHGSSSQLQVPRHASSAAVMARAAAGRGWNDGGGAGGGGSGEEVDEAPLDPRHPVLSAPSAHRCGVAFSPEGPEPHDHQPGPDSAKGSSAAQTAAASSALPQPLPKGTGPSSLQAVTAVSGAPSVSQAADDCLGGPGAKTLLQPPMCVSDTLPQGGEAAASSSPSSHQAVACVSPGGGGASCDVLLAPQDCPTGAFALGPPRDPTAAVITHYKPGSSCGTAVSSATLSSAASPAAMSCSPQLPFAFTPSSTSCSLLHKTGAALMEAHTLGRHQAAHHPGSLQTLGSGRAAHQGVPPGAQGGSLTRSPSTAGSGGAAVMGPGGVLLGRDVSDLAIIRRPSWSQRSFSQEAAVSPWIGCMSPSAHHLMLDGSQESSYTGGPSMQSFPALAGLLSPSPSNNSGTSPLLSIEGPTGLPALMSHARVEQEEDEDSLPFALEDCTDDYGAGAATAAGDLGSLGAGACHGPASGAASALAQSGSSDAAVGALARMLQEAPLLTSGGGPSIHAVLGDIESMRHQFLSWQHC